jgi:hypothetical protein
MTITPCADDVDVDEMMIMLIIDLADDVMML